MNRDFIVLAIWVVVIGAAFVVAWRKGALLRISNYFQETREELRKCSWPSWPELKGSTVAVSITIVLLTLFTIGVDFVVRMFIQVITS